MMRARGGCNESITVAHSRPLRRRRTTNGLLLLVLLLPLLSFCPHAIGHTLPHTHTYIMHGFAHRVRRACACACAQVNHQSLCAVLVIYTHGHAAAPGIDGSAFYALHTPAHTVATVALIKTDGIAAAVVAHGHISVYKVLIDFSLMLWHWRRSSTDCGCSVGLIEFVRVRFERASVLAVAVAAAHSLATDCDRRATGFACA